ncbi:hypothetical protein LJR231_000223 [Phyllobacterium sp. LjRoot231]|uniref:S10 family serine carboxypeptidase-like protein n=1 Tax=Phyllobacterium sp. LjRoot231 TaxID=3342289 RepID=UPI003ECFC562
MNFRTFSLFILVFLAACNNSDVSKGTFEPEPVVIPSVWPEDHAVLDQNVFDGGPEAGLELVAVDETPAVKHHSTTINGKTVEYTATAGHLIAYAPTDPASPGTTDAQASIFYMAYTRDDLPKENRPVTFFFNGGPGSASIWLHLGSWAPKRLKTSEPFIPESAYTEKPATFPWIDNTETLLDKSDLVFVDPVGTGYSQAIKPHQNQEFWGMEIDARVDLDFIRRYINRNNRQLSPKYLYGESYGGIRIPIIANLLETAGTKSFEPDPTGKKPIVLSGVILNSPILDYDTNCGQGGDMSCRGFLPSYGMVADYFNKSTKRGQTSAPDYANTLRTFVTDKYNPAYGLWHNPELGRLKDLAANAEWLAGMLADYFTNDPGAAEWFEDKVAVTAYATDVANFYIARSADRPKFIDEFVANPVDRARILAEVAAAAAKDAVLPAWLEYTQSAPGIDFLKDMASITGLDVNWVDEFEMTPGKFGDSIMPDKNLGIYDARLNIPKVGGYDLTFYEDVAFAAGIKTVLPDEFNYHNASEYSVLGDVIRSLWKYERENKQQNSRSSIPDLVGTLTYDSTVKMLALHGYYDLVTPFHQTELDLIGAGLSQRIPVENFEGGHMMYYSEEARVPAKMTLDAFYDAPAYTPPSVTTQTMSLN